MTLVETCIRRSTSTRKLRRWSVLWGRSQRRAPLECEALVEQRVRSGLDRQVGNSALRWVARCQVTGPCYSGEPGED
jgi:hypothetical protein